jgi:hypothetical protein
MKIKSINHKENKGNHKEHKEILMGPSLHDKRQTTKRQNDKR